ncbi:MAG: BamA/TamA family outer membrane protein [Bacteroidota bacterium]
MTSNHTPQRWALFLILLLSFSNLSAQEFVERITKFFEFPIGKQRDSTEFENKMVFAPVVQYEPATNLGLGIGGKLLFKPRGVGADTRTSNIPFSFTYTLRNQVIFSAGYTVFFNHENYLLKGVTEFSQFPLKYFGIGNNTLEVNSQEITYTNFVIEPLLLRKISPGIFVGGGIRYNTYQGVKLNEDHGDTPAGTPLQDELGSTSLGVELAITIDKRDNVLNASEGIFAEFTHGLYDEAIGSTHDFMLTKLDYRQYFKVWERRPDILGFQFYSRLAWNGTPALELSALGGPEIMRGFQEGRFRDRYAFFTQAEYRWQALDRIGFVFFAGAGEVSAELDELNISDLKYSLGSGIRIKIVKSENLNIRFDYAYGLGTESDRNFYLGIAESF